MSEEFWAKFFNRPILWKLGIAVVAAIIGITFLFPESGWFIYLNDQALPYSEIADDEQAAKIFADRATIIDGIAFNYITHFGIHIKAIVSNSFSGLESYNLYMRVADPLISLLVHSLLFLGVILITRRSSSGVFILGPFTVYSLIIAVYASYSIRRIFKMSETSLFGSSSIQGSMQLTTVLGVIGWSIAASVVAWLAAKFLKSTGLIRGIDSEAERLDFSGLKAAGQSSLNQLHKAGQVFEKIIDIESPKSNRAVKSQATESTKTLSTSAEERNEAEVEPKLQADTGDPSSTAAQRRIGNNAQFCPYCGSNKIRGNGEKRTCSLCGKVVGALIIYTDERLCPGCGSYPVFKAKFCHYCGHLFEEEQSMT